MISAHENPLAALAFNVNTTKLATASEKVGQILLKRLYFDLQFSCMHVCFQGTVIRVFSIPKGERLFEFRRGLKRSDLVTAVGLSSEVQRSPLNKEWHCAHCVQGLYTVATQAAAVGKQITVDHEIVF